MSELIVHHYPTSPFAEKLRIALGYKGLAWRSVIIPMIMPKPDLTALTGGYRKTPVLQIGADIYCDTALILRELERRHPEPTFYPPGSAGAADIVSAWADKTIFPVAVGAVFAHMGDQVPQEFREDRAKFSGRDFNLERMRAALPVLLDQMRGQLELLDRMLLAHGPFLFGSKASLADFSAFHPLWFIPNRLGRTIAPLSDYPRVVAWMARVETIGHGRSTAMSAAEALAAARAATPELEATTQPDELDPNLRRPGTMISVCPDDTGRDPVSGKLVRSGGDEIVIERNDERAGRLHVHFPRLGFVVKTEK